MISYKPLFNTMKKNHISTYQLITRYEINARTVHNLKHNKSITINTLEKLCSILHCTPNDVVEFDNDLQSDV